MPSTNVKWYCMAFSADGTPGARTICSCDPDDSKNEDKITALKNQVKEYQEDASVIEIITADQYDQYVQSGYVRDMSTGKPVPYVAPEPTEAEKKASDAIAIKAKYDSQYAELKAALATATLD